MQTIAKTEAISSVGQTAFLVAAGRMIERRRPDPLVDDPIAEQFVQIAGSPVPECDPLPDGRRLEAGAAAPVSPADLGWSYLADYQAVRSRFFDDYLLRATRSGVRQVVVLAAGLDARGFRLDWPDDTIVFEVDQPEVLSFKEEVARTLGLRPRPDRRIVPADLAGPWGEALCAAGFDPAVPTAWLAEGLLLYLDRLTEYSLLAAVDAASAPGSRLACDHYAQAAVHMRANAGFQAFTEKVGVDMGDLFRVDDRADAGDTLAGRGWSTRRASASYLALDYGRPFASALRDVGDAMRLVETIKGQ